MRFTYFTRRPSTTPTGLIFPIRPRLIAFPVGNCFLYSWYNHPIWIIKETMLKAVAYLSYAWVVQLHRRGLNLRNLDHEFLQFFVADVRSEIRASFLQTFLIMMILYYREVSILFRNQIIIFWFFIINSFISFISISILKLLSQSCNISLLVLDYSRENKSLQFFLSVFVFFILYNFFELKNEK